MVTTDGPGLLTAELRERLARFGAVVAVRELDGGRGGRTFAVEHGQADGGARTVMHLREGGAEAIVREAAATRTAHAAGAGPELLDADAALGLIVTRWVPGAALATEDLRGGAVLAAVARAIARLHGAEPPRGIVPVDGLASRRDYLGTAAARGTRWPGAVIREQVRTDAIASVLAQGDAGAKVLCHGDLVPANLVRGPSGITVLDYEYAGVAEAAFDLGGLAATAELDDGAVPALVDAYAGAGGRADVERVIAWRDVLRHSWFVWVALADDLGPQRAHWEAWSERARAAWCGV